MTPLKQDFIRLRGLIGFLGSKGCFGWWDCDFMSETGANYLRYIYPRSVTLASLRATVDAAQRFHDQSIGRGDVFHLFRLPSDTESDLLENLKRDGSLYSAFKNREAAMLELNRVSERQEIVTLGPVNIGDQTALSRREKLRTLAGIYHRAFLEGIQSLPYFIQKGE